jgi:hypothetical protein
MSIADDLVANIRAGNELFLAGVQAADENSPSARKLAALIADIEEISTDITAATKNPAMIALRNRLRFAIAEARKS